jgi:hypothetical protein
LPEPFFDASRPTPSATRHSIITALHFEGQVIRG